MPSQLGSRLGPPLLLFNLGPLPRPRQLEAPLLGVLALKDTVHVLEGQTFRLDHEKIYEDDAGNIPTYEDEVG